MIPSKGGRPPVPDEQKRTERVNLALSKAELDRVCRTALSLRLSVSAYLRLMAVGLRSKENPNTHV